MCKLFQTVTLIVLGLLITACGARYNLVKDYIPPNSVQGTQCLSKCSERNQICVDRCDAVHERCLQDARYSAEKNFPVAIDDYSLAMNEYSSALEIYYLKLDAYEKEKQRVSLELDHARIKCESNRERHRDWCETWKQRKLDYKRLRAPAKPRKPVKPTLESEAKRLQQDCNNVCSCGELYDNCYLSCGGRIVDRRICVSGCD